MNPTTYETEEWYNTLLSNKKFLYGEAVEYNFQTPRPATYLKGAKLIVQDEDGKSILMSKDTRLIVKGPYDLQDQADFVKIQHLHNVISNLHQLEFLDKNDQYNTANLAIESSSTPHHAWLLYGYGHDYVRNFYDYMGNISQQKDHSYYKYSFARILITMMLKSVFKVKNPICFKNLISPDGDIKLMGLDHADESPSLDWFVPTKTSKKYWEQFINILTKHSDTCIEAIDLYEDRFEKAFGIDSNEHNDWKKCQQLVRNKIFNNYDGCKPNLFKFGWPLHKGQRIMFKYLDKLLPGTSLENYKDHDKLDYSCFAHKFRKIRPDDSSRKYLFFTESHCDIDVEAKEVRPMTLEEQEQYSFIDDDPSFRRNDKNTSYFPGDIVKVYRERINEEVDCMSSVRKTQDMERIKGKPDDVGLVLKSGNDNPYWKTVFCWKSKVIKDVNCSSMYWLADNNGKALRVKDFESRVEEDSPLKILREYHDYFKQWF